MPEPTPERPRVSSGAVFVDDDGRILLVDPTYKEFWNLPGGAVDAGETPRQACVREVREELGLDPPIGALLVVAWTPGKLFFVFDGGTLAASQRDAIVLSPGELAAHAFVDAERARALLAPALWPLMFEVLQARAGGTTRYLELS
ncbi:NUDIX hydrolase [Actinoplanes sp. NPDC051346]|uniref:NUDIX hydrolase n=1 Tax=Actinoplanes sp. NPDC051346 TaxID=3155048 RepID=UPI003429BE58